MISRSLFLLSHQFAPGKVLKNKWHIIANNFHFGRQRRRSKYHGNAPTTESFDNRGLCCHLAIINEKPDRQRSPSLALKVFTYVYLDNATVPRTLMMSRLSRFCHLELGSSESVTSSLEICSGDLKSDAT